MANFDSFTWTRFEPDIGNNLKLPQPQRLYLEVACGLSKLQLHQFRTACLLAVDVVEAAQAPDEEAKEGELQAREAGAEKLATAIAAFVRMDPSEHSIGSRPLKSLRDYFAATFEQKGQLSLLELIRAVHTINSVGGTRALFSERLFGGSSFTAVERDAEEGKPAGSR